LEFDPAALDTDFDFDSKNTNSKGNTNWTSIPFSAKPNAVTLTRNQFRLEKIPIDDISIGFLKGLRKCLRGIAYATGL
jgi:hypothetical protein